GPVRPLHGAEHVPGAAQPADLRRRRLRRDRHTAPRSARAGIRHQRLQPALAGRADRDPARVQEGTMMRAAVLLLLAFAACSKAPGEPDYADVVDENLDPSPLYVKFIDDAARDACNKVLTADLGRADAAQRALLRYVQPADTPQSAPDAVSRNLRYLRLRFHG